MKMRKLYWLLISMGYIFPSIAIADQAQTVPQASTNSSILLNNLKNNFKFSGYVDGSYNYLVRSNQFTSGTFDRLFDLEPNGFTLQQAAITLSDQPKDGLGGLLNITAGRDANTIAPYGWDPYFGSQTLAFNPTQAYLQYASGPFTILGGIFIETAGEEVIDPTLNTNFSRSILDGYAEPFTFLGIRGTYTVNDQVSLLAGINNGWDNIRDTSRRKTIEVGVTYAPVSKFSLETVVYTGGQRATDRTATGSESIRNLLDVIATFNASDKLTFIANYDYGNQTLATLPSGNVAEGVWQGLAGYANYKFNDKWQSSLRGEIFGDRNGYRTGVVQCWKEITLTLGYAPVKNLELRAETRHDFSNVGSFTNSNGIGANNNQQSYALEAFYKFA
jgi:hypothetical protein